MSKKKKSILPGLEIMIIMVFFISFLVFAVPRCNKKKLEYQQSQLPEDTDELAEGAADALTTDTILVPVPVTTTPVAVNPVPTLPAAASQTATSYATRLYVTIDELNLRTGPSLDSAIISKLALYEEVYFLNEITPFTQEISLGTEMANEPWVKIKSQGGPEGWVYGAGVFYYKRKRDGME